MSVLIAYCNVKQYVDIIRLATALDSGAYPINTASFTKAYLLSTQAANSALRTDQV